MQIFYSNIKTKGDQAVTSRERRNMRNAIIDYGALQTLPVIDRDTEGGDDNVSFRVTFSLERMLMHGRSRRG